MSRAVSISLVLALHTAVACAQPVQVPRRILLFFEAADAGGLAREDFLYLYETLLARLHKTPVVILEPADAAAPLQDAATAAEAAARGADAWLRVAVGREGAGLVFSVAGADLLKGGARMLEHRFERPGVAGAERAFWDDLAAIVTSTFPPVPQRTDGAISRTDEVTVKALPGTRIAGLGPEPLEIGPDGWSRIVLARPGYYRIEATRQGSLPVREDRYLTVEDAAIVIQQTSEPRWMLEGYTVNASYLGGSIGEIAGPFYLRLGLTTYLFAPWLRDERDEKGSASRPLTEFVAGVGWMPLGWEHAVRPYIDASMVVRVMHPSIVALEPVAPFAYRAAAGVEISGATRFRLFADYGPMIYDVHGTDPAVVEAALTANGQRGGGYFYKPWWGGLFGGVLVDFVAFRLGLRWYR